MRNIWCTRGVEIYCRLLRRWSGPAARDWLDADRREDSRFAREKVIRSPDPARNHGFRPWLVGRVFFQQPQTAQSPKECEQSAVRDVAAGFGLEGLPYGRKRVAAARCPAQPVFIGRENVSFAGSSVNDGHVGGRYIGTVISDDLQVGTKAVSRI
jgi:hypothetical protein